MKKMNNKRGFTLAELLIVVAIIAVLVAISIPIFTSQLEKSKEATDEANLRSAYAECSAAVLSATDPGTGFTYSNENGVITCSKSVTLKQAQDNWVGGATPEIGGVKLGNTITADTAVVVTVTDSGSAPTFKQGSTDLKYTAPAGGSGH